MHFFPNIVSRLRPYRECFALWAASLMLGSTLSHAQVAKPPAVLTLPPALSCAGTGVVVEGNAWGYVVWQASTQDYLNTRDINIYIKPGDAASTAPFTLQGTATLLTDPTAITPWINRATKLRTATNGLAEDLIICANNATKLIQQWSPTTNPSIPGPLASRLSLLAVRASQEQGAIDSLRALGGNHPLFRFVSGTGWAGPLNVPVGSDATIELREVIRATGTEGTVVGRVTLRATTTADPRLSPDLLTAPGSVVQVPPDFINALPPLENAIVFPATTQLPDLAPALRWGIPDSMRPQVLLTRGFMIWRGNANVSYPNPTVLPLEVTKILRNPAAASKVFRVNVIGGTGPWANDFVSDRTSYFASDDNGRYAFTQTNPVVITGTPHIPNSQHFYHIAAADLLGRYSPLAPVGNAKAVHTLPPAVPRINRVENVLDAGQQKLQLAIQPNLNNTPGVPPTHRYLVFRDRLKNTPPPAVVGNTGLLDKSVDPARNNELIYIGQINQPTDPTREIYFTDDQLIPAAPADYGQTYYYCVRAVNNTDLGLNPSSPSPPVFGTVRDRTGPPAPTGFIFTETPRAALGLSATPTNPVADATLPENISVFRIRVVRADPGIARIRLTITSNLPDDARTVPPVARVLPDLVFGNSDSITFDYPFAISPSSGNFVIAARAVTSQGRAGKTLSLSGAASALSTRTRYTFNFETRSGTLLQMNPDVYSIWQPFFTRADNSSSVFSITPVASNDGTFSATSPLPLSITRDRALLIQRKEGIAGSWQTISTARLALGASSFVFRAPTTRVIAVEYRAFEVLDPSDDNPNSGGFLFHKSASAPAPVTIGLTLPVGTHEYRLYRRIDDGPLTLLKQDTGTWDVSALKTTVFQDGFVPPAGGAIYYFGQAFDEHGNAGPMALLDKRVEALPELPVPVVNALEADGTSAAPLLFVRASCPSPGVARLWIKMTPEPEATSNLVTEATPPGSLFNFKPGSIPKDAQAVTSKTVTVGEFNVPDDQPLIYTRSIAIKQNTEYTFQICALDAYGNQGPWSSPQTFTWKPPLQADDVAWPVRPYPQVGSWNGGITAFVPNVTSFHLVPAPLPTVQPAYLLSLNGGNITSFPITNENGISDHRGTQIPIAVSIGSVALKLDTPSDSGANWSVQGTSISLPAGPVTLTVRYGNLGLRNILNFNGSTGPDNLFHQFLHLREKNYGDIASYDYEKNPFPIALYRQQTERTIGSQSTAVTGADLVQVSPMIENIAWRVENGYATLVDPFVRAVLRQPIDNTGGLADLCIFDSAPVASGARYSYYLVHFGPDGEPDFITFCGNKSIPPSP